MTDSGFKAGTAQNNIFLRFTKKSPKSFVVSQKVRTFASQLRKTAPWLN